MELKCAVQQYAWGKSGWSSLVARLRSNSGLEVSEEKFYAELWMGTHPNGPSHLISNEMSLKTFIEEDPVSILGERVVERFGDDLPFLLKVLSIEKALSIQAHPTKDHAQVLHREQPQIYKDANHKPEMAIALTDFEALCGFRPVEEIKKHLQLVPELASVVGEDFAKSLLEADNDDYKANLQAFFKALMSAPKAEVSAELSRLEERIDKCFLQDDLKDLFKRLTRQFPGDVGCFVVFLVNYVRLSPGQSLFLAPNLIHAYISGDCVECMACSDNVVRAGLTPKLIDVPTLCSMLNYTCISKEDVLFKPQLLDNNMQEFVPSVDDFRVLKVGIEVSEKQDLPKRDSASIIIITKGKKGMGLVKNEENEMKIELEFGKVFFIKANQSLSVTNEGEEALELFQAFC